jgi:hypothetical protein
MSQEIHLMNLERPLGGFVLCRCLGCPVPTWMLPRDIDGHERRNPGHLVFRAPVTVVVAAPRVRYARTSFLRSCSVCEKKLRAGEFHDRGEDLDDVCRKCRRARQDKIRVARRRELAKVEQKVCSLSSCHSRGRPQSADHFSPLAKSRDGLESRCHDCRARLARERYRIKERT